MPRLGVVLGVCILMYWVLLGAAPFAQSEGHRVVPGWTMLETGDFAHIEMFGTTYLRKPPGMPWAIAAGSAVFGENEFGARAASALSITLMSLVAYAFAACWFGRGRPPRVAANLGLVAGLAQALMPQMWSPGRTAEIEALNGLMTQLGALGLVHLYLCTCLQKKAEGLSPSASSTNTLRWIVLFLTAFGWTGAALAKGPASLPVLVGTLGAIAVVSRSLRPLTRWPIWLPLLLAGVTIALFARWLLSANADPLAVREDVSGFLWSTDTLLGVATLIPVAWASALPVSLAWLFPWGAHARQEADAAAKSPDPSFTDARRIARLLGLAWLVSMAVFVVAGVHNPRYAMPAACFFAPMTAYVTLGLHGSFLAHRRAIARVLSLGSPAIWGLLLIGLGMGAWLIPRLQRFPGDRAGRMIAETIAADSPGATACTLWADDLIEGRPDILLYAEHAAAELSTPLALTVEWQKRAMHGTPPAPPALPALPAPGSYLLLRYIGSDEDARYADRPELVLVKDFASLTHYDTRLYRVVKPDVTLPPE